MDLLDQQDEEQQPLSGIDADKKEPSDPPQNERLQSDIVGVMHVIHAQQAASLYNTSCNANIYNAFLIAKYRKDLRFKKIDFIRRDMTCGLGVLAYLTAAVQWIALLTMLCALFSKTAQTIDPKTVTFWTAWPQDWYTLLIWPFFMIGLCSTYKQFSQIWVDIHVLKQWDIRRNKYHVFFFKYISELILYTVGSFLFYFMLSWYSKADVDFLDVILKLLSYQFIFMADEWAYHLVQDIVKRRIMPDQCNSFLQGKRMGRIYKFEMMIYISIPLSMSLIIQGIYSQSYVLCLAGFISTLIWTFDYIDQRCCNKSHPLYL